MAATMDIEKARSNMIMRQIRPWEVLDQGVLDLLSVVKREDFVPEKHSRLAFADIEIPLGDHSHPSQVMLSPKVEARLLQALAIKNTDKVLEVGTGSGYMAALLAAKAEFVYSVEIDPWLVETARANLKRAGVVNVSVDLGDAACRWPLYAPYDVIVLSASVPVLSTDFLEDLKIGGRMVAIVGNAPAMQAKLITRTDDRAFNTIHLFETASPPLINATMSSRFVF